MFKRPTRTPRVVDQSRPSQEQAQRMATNPTAKKRQREKDRQEYQRDKAALRIQRRQERAQRPPSEPGVDPDIAGIVPGPQPITDDDSAYARQLSSF